MELSESRNLVKDLDLTLQPRIAPRYKTWLPLATQQLRLRGLVQIIGHNLKANVNGEICWFYYTLHRSSMSSPLYTSEAIDNANPRWSSLEVPTLHATGYSTASEIILRVWKHSMPCDNTADVTLFTWGVSFTGLAYIGPKLPPNLETILKENSLIFYFHGGYFTPAYCFTAALDSKRYLYMTMTASEVKNSYTVNKLSSLRSKMQALKQQTESVQALRVRIASGDDFHTPKYPQTTLNRLLQPRRVNREKKLEIMKIRKELEMAKFRTKLLEQERARKMGEIRVLNQLHTNIVEENQDQGSDLMERYRELNKDIERLNEWRQNHIDSRETYLQLSNQLAQRRRQLISELCLIYPIRQDSIGKFRINDVYLPDSEELDLSNDTQVAVALGFVAHTTQMIANFLNIPTRYPIIHYGSRSKVIDHITENLPDNDRQFPLFARSKDKLQFHYAVYLLNKNIAQLRWYCGLPTTDLRATLPNLATLINVKPNQIHLDDSKRTFSTSSLDTESGNGKQNPPLTPPLQKIIFEKCHRSSRSMSQLKNIKSSLGSSLDQGLDKPVLQSPALGSQSKRICKSEESAIDNKTLVLAKDRLSNSSNETLNSAILNNIDNITLKDKKDFVEINDKIVIESNIEIMIPTSVSKARNVADSLESSVSARDRSSNSISSCEMALSGSQNDVDESSNGNHVIRKEKIDDNVFSYDDNLQNVKDAIDSALKNGEYSKRHNSRNDVSQSYDMSNTIVGEQNSSVHGQDPLTETAIHSRECFVKSCSSLNDVCIYEESEQKQRTNSICGYTEEYAKNATLRRKPSSESRENKSEYLQHAEKWPHGIVRNEPMVDTSILSAPRSECCSYDEAKIQCDIQASSEYIDVIRRSSENVCARTEALANKKTSFKVMKPRL
ncbi:PREDICTED: UV radiation resistance-associated gene protein-like [Wasmannia auropunctata]|uniref:UV radiation resistance-associated gene protein-like n=2 Tax=Wasmannia auropunctata TaxID=64793 RepID=UPI0005F02142|nr:PREDICTED: UV radiation resistance-associated gene protein-like [Wasmannia auropunctata]